jgi:hypothetical protein
MPCKQRRRELDPSHSIVFLRDAAVEEIGQSDKSNGGAPGHGKARPGRGAREDLGNDSKRATRRGRVGPVMGDRR